ncbi:hypothetical protein [Rhodococcus ruber]|uniref:hypothetical protein n=1 Tax=Rhodococcus ruber TaxID=1830 RepID=UPI001F30DB92|nr:hypothetical protein [Rhodococcus ruber]MCF8786880.1 hypothetical protein [Rhodococcus ruber]
MTTALDPAHAMREAERLADALLTCFTANQIDEIFTAFRDRIGPDNLAAIALPALHLVARRHLLTLPLAHRAAHLDPAVPAPWEADDAMGGDPADTDPRDTARHDGEDER